MTDKEFMQMPRQVQEFVIKNTFEEIQTGNTQQHSLYSIITQGRELAAGCRMLGKGTVKINGKDFTGKDIADVYIESVRKYGLSLYPLTGDWKHSGIKNLLLFTKTSDRYVPYARFNIDKITVSSTQPADFNQYCTEPDFLRAFTYKTILTISNVQVENLPQSFIGLSSGCDIYDRAFRGGAPNILML